jgi:predicted lipoprotein with Yx(FWY)xxD motif
MRDLAKLLVAAGAASLTLSACGSSSYSAGSSQSTTQSAAQSASSGAVVKTASNQALGTILVDGQGMTLYHLSGEQRGKFICTGSCLSIWHPLTVSGGGAPSGERVTLGTVKRPEGTLQVTYQGVPLYTFAQDSQPGETKGQGIKDVGTWSVATTASQASESTTTELLAFL